MKAKPRKKAAKQPKPPGRSASLKAWHANRTPEERRAAALKGWETRRRKAAEREAAEQLAATPPPAPAPVKRKRRRKPAPEPVLLVRMAPHRPSRSNYARGGRIDSAQRLVAGERQSAGRRIADRLLRPVAVSA